MRVCFCGLKLKHKIQRYKSKTTTFERWVREPKKKKRKKKKEKEIDEYDLKIKNKRPTIEIWTEGDGKES